MNRNELIEKLTYLIEKYVPKEKKRHFDSYFLKEEIPVKAVLADFNKYSEEMTDEDDGKLIQEIYFFNC
ncbi:hypothetical protein ID858_18510 [Xenorhabdus sp. DI]|uniref:hypothetical protein n=1 Tax=Xenorhabdus doucetiae TaxID=351671 RepID=UPI0019C0BB18|nr:MULTISPECIES: hypothetical protein [unclassified Xenorhabdus]MBD2786662.1 hypothetical protein [Xenorhabdus sp. 3]MBD2790475.1 hypothetical protein [Xenorhabdus sp. DI]MBD2798440.1 hypothetical protein [Xenorhabdus sp. 18]